MLAQSSTVHVLPTFVLPLTTNQCTYTSQYCEENSYKLAQVLQERLVHKEETTGSPEAPTKNESSSSSTVAATPLTPSTPSTTSSLLPSEAVYPSLAHEQVFVVFMSNTFNELRLFKQRSGDPRQDGLVCWDYHVVVMVKPSTQQLQQKCTCNGHNAPIPVDPVMTALTATRPTDIKPTPTTPVVPSYDCPCAGWIYDLDTTLPFPCPLKQYAREAFRAHLSSAGPSTSNVKHRRLERLFRVVGAPDFLANFASDRSHMLAPMSAVSSVLHSKSGVEGTPNSSSHPSDGVLSRREIAEELAFRVANKVSWDQATAAAATSPSNQEKKDQEEKGSDSSWKSPSPDAHYLAPPPRYPPIRTATCRMNLDDYRFFTYPDSGKGVVMSQDELLDFFHVTLEDPTLKTKKNKIQLR